MDQKIKLKFKNAKDRDLWYNSEVKKTFAINADSYVRYTILNRGLGRCNKHRIWLVTNNEVVPVYKNENNDMYMHPQGYTYNKPGRCEYTNQYILNRIYVPYINHKTPIILGSIVCIRRHPTSHHLVVIVKIIREHTSLVEKSTLQNTLKEYLRFYQDDNFETPIHELRIVTNIEDTVNKWIRMENANRYK